MRFVGTAYVTQRARHLLTRIPAFLPRIRPSTTRGEYLAYAVATLPPYARDLCITAERLLAVLNARCYILLRTEGPCSCERFGLLDVK